MCEGEYDFQTGFPEPDEDDWCSGLEEGCDIFGIELVSSQDESLA